MLLVAINLAAFAVLIAAWALLPEKHAKEANQAE